MRYLVIILLATTALLTSCGGKKAASTDNSVTPPGKDSTMTNKGGAEGAFSIEKNGIKLTGYMEKDEFPDAALSLTSTTDKLKAGKTTFTFGVQNYELKMQSPDKDKKMCANSDKGQHIHFIMDDQPYTALYDPQTEADLTDGYHFLVAFLSRSYHESIKHKGAYVAKAFSVGKVSGASPYDEKAPMIIYSRPKGDYVGKDAKRVMLDFYLLNCDLAHNGYRVRATINGTEFTLENWTAYFMEGLPMGENKIKLELIDAAGSVVPGPFNTVERTFTLKEDEPAAK